MTIDREKIFNRQGWAFFITTSILFTIKRGVFYAKNGKLPDEFNKKLMHGIIILNSDKSGCFIADRILFTQIIPADRFFSP